VTGPRTRDGAPHPEHDIARRITDLERRAQPDVMVWKPGTSATGKWEAMGDGWEIVEADPSAFADKLAARLEAR
jgi:D-hexose-6-phosphate mutarotase